MNDSLRDNPAGPPAPGSNGPTPVLTAAAAVPCPQCGTQLRLLRQATLQTPIACCICGTTFYIQPVETAPLLDGPDGRGPVRGPGRPNGVGGQRLPFRVISPPTEVRPRPAERSPRSPGDPPPAITTPAPPPPSPGTRAVPGMPKPVELPDHLQRGFRTSWMESVLGAVLVLLLVVAACAGGFFVIRALWARHVDAARQAAARSGAESAQADEGKPADDGKAAPATVGDVPAPVFGTAKALPRPAGLFGTWESRLDDGSYSSFDFRPDGSVIIVQAGDPPPPPNKTNWFLTEHKGGEMVVEVGGEFGTIGNVRMTLRLTAPDAFTLERTIRHGIVQPGSDLRYVRVGPTPAAPVKPAAVTIPPAAPPEQAGPPAPAK